MKNLVWQQHRHQKVFYRGALQYICAVGFDILKFEQTSLFYSVSYFNLGGGWSCGSPLLKKNSTRLGQLRKSTGEFGRSAQGTPNLTIKKLGPTRFARAAQFITIGLYSLMVLFW